MNMSPEEASEMGWGDVLTMDEALEQDGEKLRQLTGEDHGPWDYYPDLGQPDETPEHDVRESDLAEALTMLRTFLATDRHNCHAVATTVSLRQAAGETPADFVRRIVGCWLVEAMSPE